MTKHNNAPLAINNTSTFLYSLEENKLKKVNINDAIFELYYLKCRLPTQSELNKEKIDIDIDDIKKKISSYDEYIPLYDVYTFNIYLVQKRNVYIRIVKHDYRFPDKLILDDILTEKKKREDKLKKKTNLKNDKVFMRYIRKAELMINFMNSFDYETLHNTYLGIFYRYSLDNNNATYTCNRKSFIPHKGSLKPYYSFDEVLRLGMNMDIIKLPKNMKYVDYKDKLNKDEYLQICKKIQQNDINSNILIEHQNYIIKNNMVGLIQYYTLQGSYFMN